MRPLSRRAVFRTFRRRSVRTMLLAAYLVTAAGIPLPAGNLAHKSGELYPCSDCACGCASAEQCWRSCCCHSLAERMEWARVHGVRPPEFAIAEARRARLDLAWLVEPAGASCCAHQMVAEQPACCHETHSCCADHHDQHDQQPNGSTSSRVIGWKALNCQGHSGLWLAAVPTLVHVSIDLTLQLPRITRLGPPTSEFATGISDVPTPPPPQRA